MKEDETEILHLREELNRVKNEIRMMEEEEKKEKKKGCSAGKLLACFVLGYWMA